MGLGGGVSSHSLSWWPVDPGPLLWGRPATERPCCALWLQFIQWNIHKSGLKVSESGLPADATGPFVLSGYSGYKQVQAPRGRLFAFDSEGSYMLTCSATGGIIYKVPGVWWWGGSFLPEGWVWASSPPLPRVASAEGPLLQD